ncbi:hypothetical protein EDB19DRAFT_1765064, partial [Suillus lakei]
TPAGGSSLCVPLSFLVFSGSFAEPRSSSFSCCSSSPSCIFTSGIGWSGCMVASSRGEPERAQRAKKQRLERSCGTGSSAGGRCREKIFK